MRFVTGARAEEVDALRLQAGPQAPYRFPHEIGDRDRMGRLDHGLSRRWVPLSMPHASVGRGDRTASTVRGDGDARLTKRSSAASASESAAAPRLARAMGLLDREERRELRHDVGDGRLWQLAYERGLPSAPVGALDLVGKNDAADGSVRGKRYLERIALGLVRDGTGEK